MALMVPPVSGPAFITSYCIYSISIKMSNKKNGLCGQIKIQYNIHFLVILFDHLLTLMLND